MSADPFKEARREMRLCRQRTEGRWGRKGCHCCNDHPRFNQNKNRTVRRVLKLRLAQGDY